MMDSIKCQIVARVMALLGELPSNDPPIRVVERRTDVLATESRFPSIHVVFLDEENITPEEDNRGYELRLGLLIKLMIRDVRDPYLLADQITADIQAKIEGDIQLTGLANRILYQGAAPFTFELAKPFGGMIVSYDIFYRRYRANPNRTY